MKNNEVDSESTFNIFCKQYINAIGDEQLNLSESITSNFIHPTAIIGKNVKLGQGNYIGANCYIVGDTTIGNNNHFEAFCSIGTFPEHKKFFYDKKNKGVLIGNNNVFREFITINSGCTQDTNICDGVWMLRGSHVGHDSHIGSGTTLSCNVLIGGYSLVGADVNFGLGSICHQFSVIGSASMIGMGCIITKKSEVKPFGTYVGNPCRYIKENDFKKNKATSNLREFYEEYYQSKLSLSNYIKSTLP